MQLFKHANKEFVINYSHRKIMVINGYSVNFRILEEPIKQILPLVWFGKKI